jgi:P2-related tail formation protein
MSNNTIYDVKLLDLLPPNLHNDPDIIAACDAADKEFWILVNKINYVLTVADIDNARSEVVDNIAGSRKMDFYDTSLPLTKRRVLAKNALIYHFTKGTAYAIERFVEDAFGPCEVLEWFDYEGEPYHFKLNMTGTIEDLKSFQELTDKINAIKNIRSRLDGYIFPLADRTWNAFDFRLLTWNAFDALNISWDTFDTGAW